jgi:hypothetical protein
LLNTYLAFLKVGTHLPFSSLVFQPTWSTCRWVHITMSTWSGSTPAAFRRARYGVSIRCHFGRCGRDLWLPTQVSIRMRLPPTVSSQLWTLSFRKPVGSS